MSTLRRVTVTLPAEVQRAADALARRLDRSRSWVVAEAVRTFAAGQSQTPAGALREPVAAPYVATPGLGEQRVAQLESDLRLTPGERVRAAEDTIETALRFHRPPRHGMVLSFATLEDYFAWKKRDLLW